MAKPLLSDERIAELIAVPKTITPADFQRLWQLGQPKANRNYPEVNVEVHGAGGEHFRIYVQRNVANALRFAVQVVYLDESGEQYRLIRLAGRVGPHTNELERSQGRAISMITDRFRINRLTERYQAGPGEEDGFAEPASHLFWDAESALQALVELVNISTPDGAQPRLL